METLTIQLQERDLSVLQSLFESRIMTINHVAAGWFAGRKEAAKKRLQKLKSAGFIGEERRRMNEAAILSLTRGAVDYLNGRGMLAGYPERPVGTWERPVSDLTLAHEVEVLDVKSAFVTTLAKSDHFSLEEFNTWPRMHQFVTFPSNRPGGVLVKPDAAIRINAAECNHTEHFFFLEIDRSTESQDTLANRASSYVSHYRTGGFAVQRGGLRANYRKHPFRVLMVLQSAERRNNTIERLLSNDPPILTQVLLSTAEEVLADPLGSVWVRPIDYKNATEYTPFDMNVRKQTPRYRRSRERETFIESQLRKVQLL